MKNHLEYLVNADSQHLSVNFLFSSLSHAIFELRVEKIKELGIEFPQNFRFLEVLENHEGIIQKEFASRFNINQSTVTRSLNALEKEGLIKRTILENNKKNKVIVLTDRGRAVLKEMQNFDANLENEMLKGLSETEIQEFKQYFMKMVKNIHELY